LREFDEIEISRHRGKLLILLSGFRRRIRPQDTVQNSAGQWKRAQDSARKKILVQNFVWQHGDRVMLYPVLEIFYDKLLELYRS
jgi:hypothetical protein